MSKKVISTFLYVAFLLFIITPTILVIVDDTTDASIFFSVSEEEESSEKDLNVEILFSLTEDDYSLLVFTSTVENMDYIHKNYPKPHLNIISPPPELHLF